MATSRTGTTTYLRNSTRVKRQARASGLTHCPGWEGNGYRCGIELDYDHAGQPNSAVTDHVIPHALGGTDDVANLAVICADCNTRKGDGRRTPKPMPSAEDYPTSRVW